MSNDIPDISDAAWLNDPGLQSVLTTLAEAGKEGRAVGGTVRNTLLGEPVNDVDVATTARPDDVVHMMRAAGFAVHETGLQHGTVTVVANNTPIEITTLRRDIETDGRHATVAFTDDWAVDAARRDFTMNALYCDAYGIVHDPLDGFSDIAAHRVRFIGDPVARIREDYLRILRFFRFAAIFGDGHLDPDGLRAVTAEQRGLKQISAERIATELLKTLVAPNVLPIMEKMSTTGILPAILESAPDLAGFQDIVAHENARDLPPDAIRRLAALVVQTPRDGQRIAKQLRLSNHDRALLTRLGDATQISLATEHDLHVALFRYGKDVARDLVLLKHAQMRPMLDLENIDEQAVAQSLKRLDVLETPVFPLTGQILLDAGFEAGRKLGQQLARATGLWIESDFTLDQGELIEILSKEPK